jgi:hypothetical protein
MCVCVSCSLPNRTLHPRFRRPRQMPVFFLALRADHPNERHGLFIPRLCFMRADRAWFPACRSRHNPRGHCPCDQRPAKPSLFDTARHAKILVAEARRGEAISAAVCRLLFNQSCQIEGRKNARAAMQE